MSALDLEQRTHAELRKRAAGQEADRVDVAEQIVATAPKDLSECIAYVVEEAESYDLKPFTYRPPVAEAGVESSVATPAAPTELEPATGNTCNPWAVNDLTTTDNLNQQGAVTMTPIIETLWPDGTLGFLGGPSKAGKSSYALEEAVCLANGWPVLGKYAVPAVKRVLFIEEEDDQAKVNERYRALVRQHGADPDQHRGAPIWFWIEKGFQLDRPEWLAWLRRVIAKYQIDVVYLDALWRMCDNPSLERANEILAAVKGITEINRERGTAFRVIHHATKRTGRVASGQDLLGGPTLRGWARSSLMFGEPVNGYTTVSYEGKGAFAGPACRMKILATEPTEHQRSLFAGLQWAPLRGGLAAVPAPADAAPPVEPITLAAPSTTLPAREQQVLDLLTQEPRTATALVDLKLLPKRTVYAVLAALNDKGLAEVGGDKVWRPTATETAAAA